MSSSVALIEGGRSLERGVSLRSGARVREALGELGHEVHSVDADRGLIDVLRDLRPDVAFIALHGSDGEDGTIQQILGLLGIPYTGSGPEACSFAVDKALAKRLLVRGGLPTPDFVVLDADTVRELGAAAATAEIGNRLGWPLIVKPSSQGSALGVTLAETSDEVPAALLSALSYDQHAMLERYVPGRDLAVAVIGDRENARALPIVEAVHLGGDDRFEGRYEIGATRFDCPAELDRQISTQAADLALKAFDLLGCQGCARVDLMLGEDGGLQILEIDTVPGLTDTSLVPQAAEADGVSFKELVAEMLELAVRP